MFFIKFKDILHPKIKLSELKVVSPNLSYECLRICIKKKNKCTKISFLKGPGIATVGDSFKDRSYWGRVGDATTFKIV